MAWLSSLGFRLRDVHSTSGHLAAALLSAVLLLLSFPPVGFGWLAYVALVPIGVVAVRSARPSRLLLVGWVCFAAAWLLAVRWLIPVTFFGYVAVALLMAFFWALAPWGWWQLARRGVPMTLAVPLLWAGLEVLRDWVPWGGFSWLSLAHTQAAWRPEQGTPWVAQAADLFGQHTVGWIVALLNGAWIDLLTRSWRPGLWAGRRVGRFSGRVALSVAALTLAGALGYGFYRSRPVLSATNGEVARLRVLAIQPHQHQRMDEAFDPARADAAWQSLLEQTVAAVVALPADQRPDLIAWPETIVPAALNPEAMPIYEADYPGWANGRWFDQQLRDLATGLQMHLLVGAPSYESFYDLLLEDGRLFPVPGRTGNAAFLYHPDGTQASDRYEKMHRVPFGEYIPLSEAMPWIKSWTLWLLGLWDYTIAAGPGPHAFLWNDPNGERPAARLATPICYEDVVSRASRRLAYGRGGKKQADFFINLTNSAWYDGHAQRPQHLQIATLRCIENRVPMARSVNTGFSALVDSTGRVLAVASDDVGAATSAAASVSAELVADSRSTLYGRLGDAPMRSLALLGWLVVLALVRLPGSPAPRH